MAGSTKSWEVLSPDFFYLAGGGYGPLVCLIFEVFALVLELDVIPRVRTRIESNITVPQLVNCIGTG